MVLNWQSEHNIIIIALPSGQAHLVIIEGTHGPDISCLFGKLQDGQAHLTFNIIKMPVIRVSMWDGRTREQKEKLTAAITKAVSEIAKTPKEHVWIIYEDVKKSDWAIGGKLCD